MDRTQFEALRDLPDKRILQDIRFSRRQATAPAVTADGIPIENSAGIDARLNITYNSEVGSKTFNVHVVGVGPICRVDVDGPAHRPAGRSHKHALRNERCPDRNLPDQVHDRPDLSGKNLLELFEIFCQMAHIEHVGTFEAPDQG